MNLQYEKAYLVLWCWFALLAAATLANAALWLARVVAPARYVRRHLLVHSHAYAHDSPPDAASEASTGAAASTSTSASAAAAHEAAAEFVYRRPPCEHEIGPLLTLSTLSSASP